MRRLLAPLLCIATAFVVAPFAHTAEFPKDHIVVMISIDGLAGFYYDDPKAEMPTIRALGKEGAAAPLMKAAAPTVTWPNHTTLVTGDYPGRHGVLGNAIYDRATGKRLQIIEDPLFDKDQIVKVPTIYDVAHNAGLKTAAIRWPATRNAKTLDWTMPEMQSLSQMLKYTTPSLVKQAILSGLWTLGTSQPNTQSTVDENGPAMLAADEAATSIFDAILANNHPQFALLHIANVDHAEHLFGPRSKQAYEAIKKSDTQVAQIWTRLKNDYPGKATLFIVSDHGFSPITHYVYPNVALRNANLVTVKLTQITHASLRILPQGGACFVYITDTQHHDDIMRKATQTLSGVEGIARIIDTPHLRDVGMATPSEDPHAPDMMLFAKEGFSFGDTAAGALPFADKPEVTGTHGHDPSLPDLHAIFVAWGEGIQKGATLGEVRNIDVAPTLAKLLNIELPATDGAPITALLAH